MKKIVCWLNDHVEEVFMALMLTVIVFVMTLQICMRYFFKSSLDWPEELARYCFIWLVYIGMGYSIKNDEMLRVNIIEVAAPVTKRFLNVFQDLVSLAFLVFLLKPGMNVLKQLSMFPQYSPALQISMNYIFVSLEIGIVWALFRLVQKYVCQFLHRKKAGADSDALAEEGLK